MTEFNGAQHTCIGALSGMTEVLLQQPVVYMKNTIQQQRPIQWNPVVMYRGVSVNCLSICPITGIQFGVNGSLMSWLQEQRAVRTVDRMMIAGIAGIVSASVGGPAELLMTIQQRTGQTVGTTVRQVVKDYGIQGLTRGLIVTAIRDMVWSASYLALGPIVTVQLQQYWFQDRDISMQQQAVASLAGSILAGLVTVYATQPIDTIKTVMQGQLADKPVSGKHPGLTQLTRDLYRKGGISYFYRGSVARGVRLIGAVFILGQAKALYEEKFMQYGILAGI